ncbi:heavy metal-binding domain-containing protein, partial [Rhizobium leguminosarum]|uniref:heavy metal-binding domain-containing protein n=1 Tax=Rhizobium leguminosarum TaxID=384 RepID=UPI003F9E586A
MALPLHVFQDITSASRDMFGRRSKTSQAALKEARLAALDQLKRGAKEGGAGAVSVVGREDNGVSVGGAGGGGIFRGVVGGIVVR